MNRGSSPKTRFSREVGDEAPGNSPRYFPRKVSSFVARAKADVRSYVPTSGLGDAAAARVPRQGVGSFGLGVALETPPNAMGRAGLRPFPLFVSLSRFLQCLPKVCILCAVRMSHRS